MIEQARFAVFVAALGELYPTWKQTETTYDVWYTVLKDFTEKQLMGALGVVSRIHRYGAPNVGAVITAIEGEVRRVPVQQTDCWNRRVISTDGSPRISHYDTVRIDPVTGEEVPAPAQIGFGDIPELDVGDSMLPPYDLLTDDPV